jgi:hypothetical protein
MLTHINTYVQTAGELAEQESIIKSLSEHPNEEHAEHDATSSHADSENEHLEHGEEGEEQHHHGHGLEEHHEHHIATPAQKRAQRQWALIFVTAIVTASVTFETLKEITIENTPATMIKVSLCVCM